MISIIGLKVAINSYYFQSLLLTAINYNKIYIVQSTRLTNNLI